MKTVLRIYTPVKDSEYPTWHIKDQKLYTAVIIAFVLCNLLLGLTSVFIEDWISRGLLSFG